ncbi:MAG: hypothetical protein JSU61_13430 [Fidelibacterota bacterium]|nr:MAG: hypothetical protein JSU61_13430 [Candidatus Neomarinimicrobiota bacterium]
MDTNLERGTSLPIRRNLTFAYGSSLVIAALLAIASAVGLLYQDIIYPTDELLPSFVPNDVVNSFIGLLFWPGALFFVLYNYVIYVFAMPLNAAGVCIPGRSPGLC